MLEDAPDDKWEDYFTSASATATSSPANSPPYRQVTFTCGEGVKDATLQLLRPNQETPEDILVFIISTTTVFFVNKPGGMKFFCPLR